MNKPLIVLLDVDADEQRLFAPLVPGDWTTRYVDETQLQLPPGELAAVQVLSVFVRTRVDTAILAQLPALRLVATRSTGVDHIDLGACRSRGVAVCNVPEYGSATVAEHSFALLLSLSRRVYEARQRTLHGSFSYRGLTGFDLQGKVMAIAGFGRIGQHAARIAKGFGMRVLVHDAVAQPALERQIGVERVAWDALLSSADVVSLHLPGSAANRHLMDEAAFQRMKPGAVFINTARGSLVDEGALLRALDSGRLAGAGLDVIEDEPADQEEAALRCDAGACARWQRHARGHPLMVHPRVLVTPHIGFNSREALSRIAQTTVDNIAGFLAGRPVNRVG